MKNVCTVVVADDVQANIDLLTGLLVRDGYTVHAALDGGAGEDGEQELAEPRRAIALVREITVVHAGHGKHADKIKRDRRPDGDGAPADPDDGEAGAVEDDERDAAHPIHAILLGPEFFPAFRDVVGIEPLNEGRERAP